MTEHCRGFRINSSPVALQGSAVRLQTSDNLSPRGCGASAADTYTSNDIDGRGRREDSVKEHTLPCRGRINRRRGIGGTDWERSKAGRGGGRRAGRKIIL